MAYQIIWKTIRGKYGPYAYLYNSFRDPVTKMPRQKFIKYLGKIPSGTKIAHVKQTKTPALRKTQKQGKRRRRRKIQGRRPKACIMPINQICRYPRCVRGACEHYQPITFKKKK